MKIWLFLTKNNIIILKIIYKEQEIILNQKKYRNKDILINMKKLIVTLNILFLNFMMKEIYKKYQII